MNKMKYLGIVIILALVLALGLPFAVSARPLAATSPGLGAAKSFAVLAASAVTNTGNSVLNGDLGISPNNASSVTGFPPGSYTGVLHAADAVALSAQSSLTTSYTALANQACDVTLTGQNLGGLVLIPGVYCFSTSAELTGILTLDTLGDPNAVWVFKIGSTLTVASNASVTFINSASPAGCNLFWQVGSSATFGTGSSFEGNVLAFTSITMTTGANLFGRALARNGAVTLDNNRIVPRYCVASTATAAATATTVPPTATAVPPTATAVPPTATAVPPTATTVPATATTVPATATTVPPAATATQTQTVTGTIYPTETPTATTLAPTGTIVAPPDTTVTPTEVIAPLPEATGTPADTTVAPTETLAPSTATLLPVITGMPDAGGGPIRGDFPWTLLLIGGVVSAIALAFGLRAYRSATIWRQ